MTQGRRERCRFPPCCDALRQARAHAFAEALVFPTFSPDPAVAATAVKVRKRAKLKSGR